MGSNERLARMFVRTGSSTYPAYVKATNHVNFQHRRNWFVLSCTSLDGMVLRRENPAGNMTSKVRVTEMLASSATGETTG